MKALVVFKDRRPFEIIHNFNKREARNYEEYLNHRYDNHKWEIKECEIKVPN